MESILNVFKKVADSEGITISKLEHTIGASKGVLSRAISNNSDIQSKWLLRLVENYPQYNLEWLITGKGKMLREERATSYVMGEPTVDYNKSDETTKPIPLIPIEAMAGFGNGHTAQIMEYDTEKYIIPEFSELNVEFLIRMRGSSMNPKYNSGDILGCKRLPLDTFFQWGKVYVVDTIQGAIVKRIFKSEQSGYIRCVSDNEKYPPFDIEYDTQVNAIAIVLGVIRLE